MHPKAKIAVDQCARLSTYPKLTHDQAVKRVMKYLKGMDMQGLIVKPDPENGIEYYIDADLTRRQNQEKVKDNGSVLSITGNIIT